MPIQSNIVYIPRKLHPDKPAIVIELKWDQSAEGTIKQIKDRRYVDSLKDYHGNLLLVGVSYDPKTKKHDCMIERYSI